MPRISGFFCALNQNHPQSRRWFHDGLCLCYFLRLDFARDLRRQLHIVVH